MRISTKLRVNALLPVCIALAILLIIALAYRRQNEARDKGTIAGEVMRGVFELHMLSSYYLAYPEERPKMQWFLRYNSLAQLLRHVSFKDREQQAFIDRIRQNLDDKRLLFTDMVAIYEGGHSPGDERTLLALRDMLTGQLAIRSQEISSDAIRLAAISNDEIRTVHQRTTLLILSLTTALALVSAVTLMLMNREIERSIKSLHTGTEIIGAGNLNYRVGTAAQDEIGELSRAFDRMTENLKTITVSRDELAREIAVRKRTEASLKKALAELGRSNKELEQFAYVASHDLQEPLRMVASYVQLLARRYKGRLDKDADEFIAFAVDGANRMQRLISDLLEYSRVGTRGRPFAPTDSNAALGQALANLSAATAETHAVVTNDELPEITADESQLVQVFQNLIGNAIKFRKKDEPPYVHVSAERKGSEWVFRVRDNGIGIDPRYFDRIFTIFQRLHTAQEYPGAGMGLSICKKIVERHGGRIWVESREGEGSTFYFTIPAEGGNA